MDEPSVTVEMDTDARPSLATVENILSKVRLNLEDLDRFATKRGTPRVVWGVDDLRYEGHIVVRLAPRTVSPLRPPDSLSTTTASLVNGVRQLQIEPQIPDYYSSQMLARVQEISRSASHGGVRSVTVESRNGRIQRGVINTETARNAATAVLPKIAMLSSVQGVLDTISLRRTEKPRAQIYDANVRHAVDVIALPKHVDQLQAALGKRVAVAGTLSRNGSGQPVRIKMTDIVTLPDMSQRITADDLLGSSPRITGGLSVADYVDWLRDNE